MKRVSAFAMALSVGVLLVGPRGAPAAGSLEDWTPNEAEDLEFGITASVLGQDENAPWALEGGYNGAYWFDATTVAGQTFTVASDRLLQSLSVRVSAANGTTGPFELAIHEFDPVALATTTRLASASGDAESYLYGLTSVPVSTFDVSAAAATLRSGTTYMLTFRGAEGSAGLFYAQAATNIYADGSVHLGRFVSSGPDLTGTWTLSRAGVRSRGTLRVENAGNEPTQRACAVRVHLSADGVTPGRRLLTRTLPRRRAGQARSFPLRFRTPATGYVIAVLDPAGRIAERDEANNVVTLHPPGMATAR